MKCMYCEKEAVVFEREVIGSPDYSFDPKPRTEYIAGLVTAYCADHNPSTGLIEGN
jgi:hypothetical protein